MQSKITVLLLVSFLILTFNYFVFFSDLVTDHLGHVGSTLIYLVPISPILILNRIKIDKEKEQHVRFILGIIYVLLGFGLQLIHNYLMN